MGVPPRYGCEVVVQRAGTIDDPIWKDGTPLPEISRRPPRRPWVVWVAILAAALIVALVAWLVWSSAGASTTGDPGGKIMKQLAPAVTVLPGYGTGAVPWVSEIPQDLGASYAIKIEPQQDSCDGRAGTQGWDQVVVQAGFQWSEGQPALLDYMNPRLTNLGWSGGSGRWTKTLRNGTEAVLMVDNENGSHWQLDAMANPVGKAASGC
jgi:hypothetical protein